VRAGTDDESRGREEDALLPTKILIPLSGDDVAPRFDLAQEAFVATISRDGAVVEDKTIILPHASAEALCNVILTEKIDTVVCCGIEEEYYEYLKWKKVRVIDSVVGPYARVLERVRQGALADGDILLTARERRFPKKRGSRGS
jgi:predicted Fe-Mo cluster-binding NifX family protein